MYKDIILFYKKLVRKSENRNILLRAGVHIGKVVTLAGFEPATSRAEICHSIQLNYRARYIKQMYQNSRYIRYI